MKVGLKLNTQFTVGEDSQGRVRELLEQVRLARDAGFDSVWVSQHYLAKPYQMVQTWPMIGRIAAESGSMVLGTSIFLLTLHNPVFASEHAATMDVISGGRFVFGVGLGYREEEFEAFGVDGKQRVSRFTEALDVTLRLWTESEVTHRGLHFVLTKATLPLRPVQRPHPPVWIAASNDPAVVRAARYGFPWLVNPHAGLATVQRQMALYRKTLADAGKPVPEDLPILKEAAIARTREAAFSEARPYLEGKYKAYADWGLDKPMPKEDRLAIGFEQLTRDRFIIGTPDEVREEMRRLHRLLGVNHFLLRLQWPGMPHGRALEQIDLLGKEVLPALRAGIGDGTTGT